MLSKYWREGRYGYSHLNLGSQLTITAGYDSMRSKNSTDPPYMAEVFGSRIGNYNNIEEAKAAAEQAAKKVLQVAWARLVARGTDEQKPDV